MTAEEIYAIPAESGWRKLPTSNYVKLGDNVWFGNSVVLGDGVTLGNNVRLNDNVRLGHYVMLGERVRLGDNVVLGDYVILGDRVRLGDNVRLGNNVMLGDGVILGDNVSSEQLNLQKIEAYKAAGDSHVFVKWVTQNRFSPNSYGSMALEYPKGAIVKAEGEVSDQQCAAGLHVLRVGVLPEHVPLCGPDHSFIGLLVRVKSEDILHAGMPGNDEKLRVRRLEVLT